jgi:natural product precursor
MERKIKLNKEVIAKLNDDSMNKVVGGGDVTHTTCGATFGTCQTLCGKEIKVITHDFKVCNAYEW